MSSRVSTQGWLEQQSQHTSGSVHSGSVHSKISRSTHSSRSHRSDRTATTYVAHSDVVKFDLLIRMGITLSQTFGYILLMVPNANLAAVIWECIQKAQPGTFWSYAQERVIGVLFDVAAMAQAIADNRTHLPPGALIVVRFLSNLDQPMNWGEFHLHESVRPIAFIAGGVMGHANGKEAYETCLHKKSAVGSVRLFDWNPNNPSHRGVARYGLGFHQSTMQALIETSYDVAKTLSFFFGFPALVIATGVSHMLWGNKMPTQIIEGLKDRMITYGDVHGVFKPSPSSDFRQLTAVRLAALNEQNRITAGSSTRSSSLPSYQTFDPANTKPTAYRHSQSSSYAGTLPRIQDDEVASMASSETFKPRPIDPLTPLDPTEERKKRGGFWRRLFKARPVPVAA